MGHAYGVRVLKMDRPEGRRVRKFDGPSGRGLRIAFQAMLIKSALREWLPLFPGMIGILVISHLRWLFPPLVPYGTTFPPLSGGTIKSRKAIPS